MFVFHYLELLLAGAPHHTAIRYARNMSLARRQRKEQAKRRRERISSIVTPFE